MQCTHALYILELIETYDPDGKQKEAIRYQIKIVLMVKMKLVTKRNKACLVCIYVADLPQYACWI